MPNTTKYLHVDTTVIHIEAALGGVVAIFMQNMFSIYNSQNKKISSGNDLKALFSVIRWQCSI